jgi:membrane protein
VTRIIVSNAKDRPDTGSVAGICSLVLLIFAATAVFGELQDVLNRIFRTDSTRLPGLLAWLRKRVFSFGLVIALGFLLVVSMTVNTALQLTFARFTWMLPIMAAAITWLSYGLGFALMYLYLPDRRIGWRCALIGGAFTASLFVLGRSAIGWYLASVNPGAAYGAMSALVLMLIWTYYAGLIVFIGALLTAVIDERGRMPEAAKKPATPSASNASVPGSGAGTGTPVQSKFRKSSS